jgi:hypothetical protein
VLSNLAAGGTSADLERAAINDVLKRVRSDSNNAAVPEISIDGTLGKPGSVITIRGEASAVKSAASFIKKQLDEFVRYIFFIYYFFCFVFYLTKTASFYLIFDIP